MSNHTTHRFGGGLAARLRSPRGGGRGVSLCVALGLLVCAVPALAAEIVEVRVGKHPTFTRVVFELDRAAGYRIERSDPSLETAELIVSLEATSIPRSISKQKALIEQVDVEPQGRRSVARVKLSQDGLRLKEMILSNPPRIVLDLLNDEAAPRVAASKPAPLPSRTSDASDFDDVVAGIEPEPKKAAPIARASDASQTADDAADELAAGPSTGPADEPATKPAAKPAPVEMASDDSVDEDEASAAASDDDDGAFFDDDPQVAAFDEPSTSVPAEAPEVARAAAPPAPVAPEKAEPRKPRPMVAKSTPEEEGGGLMTWALAGGAVLLLAAGAFIALKRRGGASGEEWNADEDGAGSFGDEDTVVSDANPFASADEPTMLGGPDDVTVAAGTMDGDETTRVDVPDDEKESESVLFDTEEKDMDDMEVISRDQVNESLGSAGMPSAGAGASDDVQQMFAEMTRRMEALESRCDELVDARDRLERQVAAQTEELRVQRAAIARTQRAVRNLGRGDEAAEEHEATEPALREPTPE